MLTVTRYLQVLERTVSAAHLASASPSRYGPGERPPVVVWNLTRQCNQRCAHCYATAMLTRSEGELDTDACRRVLDEMAQAQVPAVIFSGGEPLLRSDLEDLVKHANDVGIRAHVSSNGTLVTPSRIARLVHAGVAYLGVSIDGPAAFNDTFRGMTDGWKRAVRGLLVARDAGVRTGLRMTVTADNAHTLPEMFRLAEEVGASRFYVSHLVQVGRAVDVAALSPARTRALLWDLFDLALRAQRAGSPVGVVTGGNDSAGPAFLLWARQRLGADAAATILPLLRARGGNTSGVGLLCIDDAGLVHPDQFWRTQVLGDLKHQPFSQVLGHPLRAELARRKELLEGRCGACRHVDLCAGSHRERAIALQGRRWGPDPSCVLTDVEVGVEDVICNSALPGVSA